MDSMLITMIATAIYNLIAPFLLEKGKWSRAFPFMQPFAGVLNNVTSFVVAFAGSVGVTYAVDAAHRTVTIGWPEPAQAVKALIVAVVGYLIQKFAYTRAIKQGGA